MMLEELLIELGQAMIQESHALCEQKLQAIAGETQRIQTALADNARDITLCDTEQALIDRECARLRQNTQDEANAAREKSRQGVKTSEGFGVQVGVSTGAALQPTPHLTGTLRYRARQVPFFHAAAEIEPSVLRGISP